MAAKPAFETGLGDLGLDRDPDDGPGRGERVPRPRATSGWTCVLRDVAGLGRLLHADLASLPIAPRRRDVSRPAGHAYGPPERSSMATSSARWCSSSTPSDSLRDIARRRVGRQPDRPDGGCCCEQPGTDRHGHRRALVGPGLRPRGRDGASGIVDAQTWVEEPRTRDAFLDPPRTATAGRRRAGGPATGAVRRVRRRRRGDHRSPRRPGPPRGRAAGPVRSPKPPRTPAAAASPTRCRPTAARCTRRRSRS